MHGANEQTTHQPQDTGVRADIAVIVIGIFLIGIILPMYLWAQDWYKEVIFTVHPEVAVWFHPAFRMLIVAIGSVIVWSMLSKNEKITFGLLVGWRRAAIGLAIGFGCTIPMLLLGQFSAYRGGHYTLIYSTILPGVTEELFYRAFAFGLLVQAARMKLWPAAFLTAILFGLAHLINASLLTIPVVQAIGWIGMIAAGGLFYAWIYARAPWNLWVIIALHAGMNFWWEVFDLNSSALGVTGATISRIMTVGLAIYFVIFRGALRPPSASTINA